VCLGTHVYLTGPEIYSYDDTKLHIYFFSHSLTAPRGPRPAHFSRCRDHTLLGLLWTSDQPVAETST
jgi:hypothetical protein